MASALVDAERRAQFEEAGAHYESSYFLTFLYLPPAEGTAKAERLLYEGSNRTVDADAREVLRGFVDRTNRVLQLVEGFMPECAWLDDRGDPDLPALDGLDQAASGQGARNSRCISTRCSPISR